MIKRLRRTESSTGGGGQCSFPSVALQEPKSNHFPKSFLFTDRNPLPPIREEDGRPHCLHRALPQLLGLGAVGSPHTATRPQHRAEGFGVCSLKGPEGAGRDKSASQHCSSLCRHRAAEQEQPERRVNAGDAKAPGTATGEGVGNVPCCSWRRTLFPVWISWPGCTLGPSPALVRCLIGAPQNCIQA